jgi:uncharacterized protein YeaO (DUF488 family)
VLSIFPSQILVQSRNSAFPPRGIRETSNILKRWRKKYLPSKKKRKEEKFIG